MVKRLAVVLLALALVMSYAGMAAGAAKFTDTADSKHQAAIERIASLGVVQGYPDGTFKPEGTITRAEFAAVMCRVLGLEDAAKIMAGSPTSFSDVAVDHWATGYINVASSQGIINGYPDGTFKPEAPVNYAEAMAMVIRALGYTTDVLRNAVWPTTYIAKGAELGISDGVTVAANVPAVRGDVARMVDNSLDVPKVVQVGFGGDVKYVVSGTENTKEKTLLDDNLGMTRVKGVVTDAGVLFGSGLAAGKIEVTYNADWKVGGKDTGVYKLTGDVDPASLVGLEISAWANEDDEIFMVGEVKDEDVKSAYVVGVDPATDKVQLGKPGDYKEYVVSDKATIVKDFALKDVDDLDPGWADSDYAYAKYLVKDREIVYLNITTYDDPQIVEEINTKYSEIRTKTGGSIDYADIEYTLIKDGKLAKVEDLKENDVLYEWHSSDGDRYVMVAFSSTASGELEAASSTWSTVTVDGKDYKVIPGFYLSDDEGDSFASGDADTAVDYLGTDVVLHLGFDGKVVAFSGKPSEPSENYGLVYDVKVGGALDDTVYVRLYDENAKKKDLATASSTKFNGSRKANWNVVGDVKNYLGVSPEGANKVTDPDNAPAANYYLVKYSLSDDGKLASISTVDVTYDNKGLAIDDDNDRVTVAGGPTLVQRTSTRIWNIIGDEKVDTASWASLEKASDLKGSVVRDGNLAKIIIVSAATTAPTAPKETAMVTGMSLVSSDTWKITLDIKGEAKSYTFDEVDVDLAAALDDSNRGNDTGEWSDLKKGNIVSVTFDGSDLSVVEEVYATGAPDLFKVKSVNASDKMIEVWKDADDDGVVDDAEKGTVATYYGDTKTVVYDCTGSSPEYVEFGAVRRGYLVQFEDSSGVLKWVKVVKPDLAGKIMGD